MAADKSKALVLSWMRNGSGWMVSTVPFAAFTGTHIGAPGFASAPIATDALVSLGDGKTLDVGADGRPSPNSPFGRWSLAVTWSQALGAWIVAMGDAKIDGRTVIAEKPDFASAMAAAIAAMS